MGQGLDTAGVSIIIFWLITFHQTSKKNLQTKFDKRIQASLQTLQLPLPTKSTLAIANNYFPQKNIFPCKLHGWRSRHWTASGALAYSRSALCKMDHSVAGLCRMTTWEWAWAAAFVRVLEDLQLATNLYGNEWKIFTIRNFLKLFRSHDRSAFRLFLALSSDSRLAFTFVSQSFQYKFQFGRVWTCTRSVWTQSALLSSDIAWREAK